MGAATTTTRITPEAVREAYEVADLLPASGTFLAFPRFACPVTALLVAKAGAMTTGLEDEIAQNAALMLGLEERYVKSFMDGYDAYTEVFPGFHDTQGYKDGLKVRERIPPIKEY